MKSFKWFRKWVGGNWYKYEMSGQLPGCYGSWWSTKLLTPHRYYNLVKTESY